MYQVSRAYLEMLAYVEGYFAGICIMGYDLILRGGLPAGLGVICYGDDTLITVCGANFQNASTWISLVAMDKTEALLFYGPHRGPPEHLNHG